jgi:hypothetical protein
VSGGNKPKKVRNERTTERFYSLRHTYLLVRMRP